MGRWNDDDVTHPFQRLLEQRELPLHLPPANRAIVYGSGRLPTKVSGFKLAEPTGVYHGVPTLVHTDLDQEHTRYCVRVTADG